MDKEEKKSSMPKEEEIYNRHRFFFSFSFVLKNLTERETRVYEEEGRGVQFSDWFIFSETQKPSIDACDAIITYTEKFVDRFTSHSYQFYFFSYSCSLCIWEFRTWKEDIYWNNFHSVQFFQSLSSRFHLQLAIPQRFASNMTENLGKTVTLKGPSGATWNIGLTASGGTLFFKQGWKNFVEDNSLKENDMLIFKYKRDSGFEVQMFDGRTFCEKEGSYFNRKCEHQMPNNREVTKKVYKTDSSKDANSSSDNDDKSTSSRKRGSDDSWKPASSVWGVRTDRASQKTASVKRKRTGC